MEFPARTYCVCFDYNDLYPTLAKFTIYEISILDNCTQTLFKPLCSELRTLKPPLKRSKQLKHQGK